VQGESSNISKQLYEWLKFMSDLYKLSIRRIGPKRRDIGKGKTAMQLAAIMKYQGINEREMQDAIKMM
jgi:hypothetical protein